MYMRVTVDDSHGSLLQDLIKYDARKRSKRLVYLAAIGYLIEHGSLSCSLSNTQPAPASVNTVHTQRSIVEELRPFEPDSDQLAFLKKLSGDL